jgi:hypothetical protein
MPGFSALPGITLQIEQLLLYLPAVTSIPVTGPTFYPIYLSRKSYQALHICTGVVHCKPYAMSQSGPF